MSGRERSGDRVSRVDVDELELPSAPGARNYTIVCVAAMGVLLLALIERGLWPWALIPVLIGVLGVVFRWRMATPVLVIFLGLLLFFARDLEAVLLRSRMLRMAAFQISDILLCASVFAYAAGHYRLLGLTAAIFPRDLRPGVTEQSQRLASRKPPPRAAAKAGVTREDRLASASEVLLLLLTLPVWVALGQMVWLFLRVQETTLNLELPVFIFLLVVWSIGLGLFAASAVFGYLRQVSMTPEEARMYLQDVYWRETRGEQRLVNRWLAWARRRRRHKEKR